MPVTRCTEQQAREWLATWAKNGFNCSACARADSVDESTWRGRIRLARKTCPDTGIVPTDVPERTRFTKTTVQYDADGRVIQEWRRLSKSADNLESFVRGLEESVKGKAPALPPLKRAGPDDLLLEVPIFDAHFGKYCWESETGTDYDSDTAYRLVTGATSAMADRAGEFGQALLIIGGDYFHSDTRHNRTEASGHALDVDTRHHKVWQRAVAAVTHSVEILARKARHVKIIVIRGNHDEESGYHLQRLLAAWYRNEKRVEVDETPRPRKYHQHGIVLLGIDHGDKLKARDLPSLMALEVKDLWAKTIERVWHRGHFHIERGIMSQQIDGMHSVQCEHLESLAGTDAWHAEMGFVGMPQRACGFLWSAKHGLRQRIYVNAREILNP